LQLSFQKKKENKAKISKNYKMPFLAKWGLEIGEWDKQEWEMEVKSKMGTKIDSYKKIIYIFAPGSSIVHFKVIYLIFF
jgi:hypothetical protein